MKNDAKGATPKAYSPNHSSTPRGVGDKRRGGGGIGEEEEQGMKKSRLGSHGVIGIIPILCRKRKISRCIRIYTIADLILEAVRPLPPLGKGRRRTMCFF